jgi:hypothetical protein
MNNWLKILLFVLTASLFVACSPVQKLVSDTKAKKRTLNFLLRQLQNNSLKYLWFGTKAKIKFEDNKNKVAFSAIIRMQKDSLIWIKLKKMNVEGVRVRITPETIEIINRQESSYLKKPFSFLKNEFGLDVSFSDLQNLIVGNPVFYENQKLSSFVENNQNVLKTPSTQKSVLKIYMEPQNFLLNEIRGSADKNSVCIEYADYTELNNQKIATLKDIHVDSEESGIIKVKMSFSKMILDEIQKVGFSVPDSYSRE